MPPDAKTLKEYEKLGIPPPSVFPHGMTPDQMVANLQPATPRNWRQEGNKLICDTEFGELVNYLPTDKLLTGTDELGMPVFTDVLDHPNNKKMV